MAYVDDEVVIIRNDLKRRSGKAWSVRRGRGGDSIYISAPPRRLVDSCMTDADEVELAALLGLDPKDVYQIVIGPENLQEYLARARGSFFVAQWLVNRREAAFQRQVERERQARRENVAIVSVTTSFPGGQQVSMERRVVAEDNEHDYAERLADNEVLLSFRAGNGGRRPPRPSRPCRSGG